MKTIEEKNKLIAEFMQLRGEYDEDEKVIYLESDIDGKGIYSLNELKYNSSWNWLMEVVKKIYDLRLENEPVLIVRDALTDASLVGTFDAVVEFIEWYNEEK